jgi:pyruvate,water dikinase
MRSYIREFSALPLEEYLLAGGKGATLARLFQDGYPVPNGFIILPAAFQNDQLHPAAWEEIRDYIQKFRKRTPPNNSFAVRSSAWSEDTAQTSFAGEFESVLNVHTDEALREAVVRVRNSRNTERVRAYSQTRGIPTDHEMAVIVQRQVAADYSGVLFTADPLTGDRSRIVGNYVHGLGETLVSGEVQPRTFEILRPHAKYHGPAELKRYRKRLYQLSENLEFTFEIPQDIEWCIAEGKLFLLQARPITTMTTYNLTSGAWNDSLGGDYVWSNANLSEAVPDVMTLFTWSVWERFHRETSLTTTRYPLSGNICGRPYANISTGVSFLMALGKSKDAALKELATSLGEVPQVVEVPVLPISRGPFLLEMIPKIINRLRKAREIKAGMDTYLSTNPETCTRLRGVIQGMDSTAALLALWEDEVEPLMEQSFWMVRISAKISINQTTKLLQELNELVGEEDAQTLISYLSREGQLLASLGPLVGIQQLASGEIQHSEYLERFGHRGPHEAEFSMPRPAEQPEIINGQLDTYRAQPVDIKNLLSKQQAVYDATWKRFNATYPQKASRYQRRLEEAARSARHREELRSEFARMVWVMRVFAQQAGAICGLEDDIFHLTLPEVLTHLECSSPAVAYIPNRRATYQAYTSLPLLPTIIRGRFDPATWVSDPARRSDYFDPNASTQSNHSPTITGFPGAAGHVEGIVRRLDSYEQGHELQDGEILVTSTTNIGWTTLFPRVSAIITDVGAPLSHAAIVARELGIPAVVGCGDATMRLQTGDQVMVDGGRGVVEIMEQVNGT